MAKNNIKITFDDSSLQRGLDKLGREAERWFLDARRQMADTLLLLSRFEVPHDTGNLQTTGHVYHDPVEDSVNVAYNTKYASFVHEGVRRDGSHRIKHYQKGRKKKYLQDPLLNNISKWEKIAQIELAKALNGDFSRG